LRLAPEHAEAAEARDISLSGAFDQKQ